jgi:hypothetical protein
MKNTKKKSNTKARTLTNEYSINVGDRFYLNSHTVRKGLDLPDFQIVTWIKGEFFGVKYENRAIGNLERIMGIT